MKVMQDGILLDPKNTNDKIQEKKTSDEIVRQKSEEIEKQFEESFRLLAKDPEK